MSCYGIVFPYSNGVGQVGFQTLLVKPTKVGIRNLCQRLDLQLQVQSNMPGYVYRVENNAGRLLFHGNGQMTCAYLVGYASGKGLTVYP